MHTMSFRVPGGSPPGLDDALESASIAYGHDRAPAPTERGVHGDLLLLARDINESGPAYVPWEVPGVGRVMCSTATLTYRKRPYHLLIELARGKLNEVRNTYADWQAGGLTKSTEVEDLLKQATKKFGQAILDAPSTESDEWASEALGIAYKAAEVLVTRYRDQVFQFRHQRQPKLDTLLGCRLVSVPPSGLDDAYRLSFNSAVVPCTWREIETGQSNYDWSGPDAVVAWSKSRGLTVTGGPVIDFSPKGLPDYVLRSAPDAIALKSLMCDFVETVVSRYRGTINRWVIATGACGSNVLGLSEEDLLRLTAMAADAAWQIDPNLQIVFGLSRPFSDYLASPGFNSSAFVFADTLLRTGLPFAGIDLEMYFGTTPRGNYARDLLDISRQLDLFGLLGAPVQVSLAYPASSAPDANADPSEGFEGAGLWRDQSAAAQADWVTACGGLALCKSFVTGVCWDHFMDSSPHRLPNVGLVDNRGQIRPAFDRLRALREEHLK